MAKQIKGVSESILACAKTEILEKGFEGASLRTIAQKAGTSTNSIYVRFRDKSGLFEALVKPAAEGLKEMVRSMQEPYIPAMEAESDSHGFTYADDCFPKILSYLYDNFDTFRLLMTCSYGTPYADFIHELSVIDAESYKRYIEASGNDALSSGRASENLLHLLSSGFYSGLLELVVHNITREEAEKDLLRLRKFYLAGWLSVLNA